MGMPRNKAPLGTSSKGKADEHKSTWINIMQCSESALGGEVCAFHCGNPRGKLLISFLLMGQVPGKASQRRWNSSHRELRD